MGLIMSLEDEIARIRFVRFPVRKKANVASVVRVGRIVMADLGGNEVACSKDMENWAIPGWAGGYDDVVEGLRRLGVVSASAVNKHKQHGERVRKARDRKSDIESVLEITKRLGLSAKEQRALSRAIALRRAETGGV